MKKHASLFIALSSGLILSSCSLTIYNYANETKYQKVGRALDAVASSLSQAAGRKNAPRRRIAPSSSDEQSALSTIGSSMGSTETRSLSEELDLNSPPMAQFNYMASVFDRIGEDFVFGAKYYDEITGSIYLDMDSGYKDSERNAANKYDYKFVMSVAVDYDEKSLVTAGVGFDITLTQGSDSHHTEWFVAMDLDFDFESRSKANYKMAMYTDNYEKELPFLEVINGYEYDYVDVQNSEIKEWRKFRYASDRELLRDESHQTLQAYVNEGAAITVDVPKWYKDGTLVRSTSLSQSNSDALASAYFSGLGLNSADLETTAFRAKEGTRSDKIAEVYRDVSQKYGDDILYNLVCKNEDNHSQNGGGDNNGSGQDQQGQETGWPSNQINGIMGFEVPIFYSESATFSLDKSYDNPYEILVTVTGAAEGEWEKYASELVSNGFVFQGEMDGLSAYVFMIDDSTGEAIIIGLAPSSNIISIQHITG